MYCEGCEFEYIIDQVRERDSDDYYEYTIPLEKQNCDLCGNSFSADELQDLCVDCKSYEEDKNQ